MTPDKDTPRLLGAAFLIQAVASAVSGLFLLQPLIVPGNIVDSMTNIANHALQMRASIVVEMITAIGIVMLGALLFVTLRHQNMKVALGATLFYTLFYRSGFIPRVLSIRGLIAAPLALVGTLFVLLGYDVPLEVFLPNLPFELTMGVWLLVKGIRPRSEAG